MTLSGGGRIERDDLRLRLADDDQEMASDQQLSGRWKRPNTTRR